MAQQRVKRLIVDTGIVLSKEYKEASDEWVNAEGRKVDAQPERFLVTCASGEAVSEDEGLRNCYVDTYKVSREEFQKIKYLQKVKCTYEFSSYGCKPVSISLEK